MLWKVAVLHLPLEAEGKTTLVHVTSIRDRLGRRDKASGETWDWLRREMIGTCFVNSGASTGQDLRSALLPRWCPAGSGKKERHPDLPQVCGLRCRKTVGSMRVKVGFCQGDGSLGQDCFSLESLHFRPSFGGGLRSLECVRRACQVPCGAPCPAGNK